MNTDILRGKWNQLRGDVQKNWGKLTDNQLNQINGDRTKLLGAVQESYGIARDEAEKQIKAWEDSMAA